VDALLGADCRGVHLDMERFPRQPDPSHPSKRSDANQGDCCRISNQPNGDESSFPRGLAKLGRVPATFHQYTRYAEALDGPQFGGRGPLHHRFHRKNRGQVLTYNLSGARIFL
jgi:hypothetical protein